MHLPFSLNGHYLAMVSVKDLGLYKILNQTREACRCKLDHTGSAAVSGLDTALHADHCCHLLGCHHSLDHLCAPPQQTAPGMSVTTSAHTLSFLHVCYDTPVQQGSGLCMLLMMLPLVQSDDRNADGPVLSICNSMIIWWLSCCQCL